MAHLDRFARSLARISGRDLGHDTGMRELEHLAELLREIGAGVRAELHPRANAGLLELVRRLEAGEPLAAEDRARLRCWVIAEAEACERARALYRSDVDGFNRNLRELCALEAGPRSVETLGKLAGLVRETERQLERITRHRADELRIRALEKASNELDAAGRRILARLLRAQLRVSRQAS